VRDSSGWKNVTLLTYLKGEPFTALSSDQSSVNNMVKMASSAEHQDP